ncbi:MAG: hypothetical protein AABY07_07660, partial [Nanoarchaeota archaeon]
MPNALIVGWGHYLPNEVITNDFFIAHNPLYAYDEHGRKTGEPIVTSDEWIRKRMGIRERRRAKLDEQVHHMGA